MLMPFTEYSVAERDELLAIARSSITQGVNTGQPLTVDTSRLPAALQAVRCSFVTLQRHGELRGCTGSMEPVRPLAIDVAEAACQTALSDPRFFPVQVQELAEIEIEISVLSPLDAFPVAGKADLLSRLQPGIDGLVVGLGPHRATFLPKVWESLSAPEDFVGELLRKAGLPRGFWSDEIELYRYRTETFSERESVTPASHRRSAR